MARPPTPPSNLRQDTFISSTEVRTSYIKPFATRHYFAFIKDPRWPPAFIDNGGVRVYVREKIDEFLRRIAAEGLNRVQAMRPRTVGGRLMVKQRTRRATVVRAARRPTKPKAHCTAGARAPAMSITQRQRTLKLGDCKRAALVAEVLERNLRGWPRARWDQLTDRLRS